MVHSPDEQNRWNRPGHDRRARELAGFTVERIINEPTAAALDEATRPLADLLMDRAMEALLQKRGLVR